MDGEVHRASSSRLRVGVSEEGKWSKTEVGTPQGAVASPLLANIYLHYVFDLWVEHWRKHHAGGDVVVVRYADDIVVGFEHRAEAERFLQEWKDRLLKVGLELHPDKTRPIEFGRHAAEKRRQRGEGKPARSLPTSLAHLQDRTVARVEPTRNHGRRGHPQMIVVCTEIGIHYHVFGLRIDQ
jgi:RNA-directed DNA polymerase